MQVADFLHWLTTTRYTRMLEAEVERLRADNIALRASVFGLVGRPGQAYAAHLIGQLYPRKTNGESKTPEPARRHVSWAEIRKRLEERDASEVKAGILRGSGIGSAVGGADFGESVQAK